MAALYVPATATVVLGAFALRLVMLAQFPFREDEAAYAYWALHGWFEDPMFLQVWPDKPPVYLWLLGAAFRLFGVSEAGARLVNIGASTMTVPIAAAIARRLWGRRAALAAAAVLALSPYAISFAPTAYTDPVLVLAGTASVCAAVYNRSFLAGLLLGVAVMTKQQGVLFTPLTLGVVWLADHGDAGDAHSQPGTPAVSEPTSNSTAETLYGVASQRPLGEQDQTPSHRSSVRLARRNTLVACAKFAAGTALILLPILYWDSLRWSVAPSPWDLAVRNYATVTVLSPSSWPARLAVWAPLLFDLTASWAVWATLGGLLGLSVLVMCRGAAGAVSSPRHDSMVVLVAGWSLAFLGSHLVSTVQPWDRYLLPLAPMLALVASWAVSRVGQALSASQVAILSAATVLLLVPPARHAAMGQLAVGGDHGDYTGLTDAVRVLEDSSHEPFVLYHRTLGSHYRFYLYARSQLGLPGERVDLRWFPSVVYLADNAAKTPHPRKFLIEPDWAPIANLEPHLAMRGLSLARVGRYGRFAVWEIESEPSASCTWCASREPYPWPEVADEDMQATLPRP